MTNRRQFIKHSLASSAMISVCSGVPQFLLRASATTCAKPDETILVVIQLSGGNDGLNTIVPYGDDDYYKNRFTLAINRNNVLKIDDHIGFHPSLGGLANQLEKKHLSVVQGVGYPNPNRSHFESMDLWHTAHRIGSGIPSGWLGRYVERQGAGTTAIHYGREQQPLALASKSVPVPSIKSLEGFRLRANSNQRLGTAIRSAIANPVASDNELLGFIHDSTAMALTTSQKLDSVMKDSKKGVQYPQNPLGRKLQAVGQLIGAGLKTRIYYVTMDGFDTHSNQAEAHASLLTEFGGGVDAFMNEMKVQGNEGRVCVMAFSEFGRRVRENASRGTDHGTAAPLFLLGSKVKPGPLGEHPSLADLDQGDLKYRVDYRRIYATILSKWLNVDPKPILGEAFKTLDLFSV